MSGCLEAQCIHDVDKARDGLQSFIVQTGEMFRWFGQVLPHGHSHFISSTK